MVTLPNVELARMDLLSYIQSFCHSSSQCHTALISPYSLPQRDNNSLQMRTSVQTRMKSLIQITEAQLRRETHTTLKQKALNHLIKGLSFTKSNAELLTSRLNQWNLLDESVQVAVFFKLFLTSRGALLLLQCDRSVLTRCSSKGIQQRQDLARGLEI